MDFRPGRSSFDLFIGIALPFLIGRGIARRSGGREIASWLTAMLLQVAANLVFLKATPNAHWSLLGSVEFFSLTLLGAMSALNRPRLVKGLRLPGVAHA